VTYPKSAFRYLAFSFLGVSLASGQAVPPASAPDEAEKATQISPFIVNTDRDSGFVAASSLAGGRLATDLADTPAAYSVLTREFIDALNIPDLATAIEWTVNTNANTDNGALQNSQVNNLVTLSRGVTAGTPQRNFFPFGVNFDSYNLDRFDFSRGPNAILFGNGALGGSANVVTKQARFDRPLRELTTSVGSWANYRTTVDINQPVNKTLAVRTNAVWQDAGGWRDRDYSKTRAATLTGTIRLSSSTELRAEGEYGEINRQAAFFNINDSFAGWDGATTFAAPLTATPTNANAHGVARNATTGYYVYAPASGLSSVVNYQNSATTLGAGANNQVPIGGRLYVGSTPNASGTTIFDSLNLPDNRFDSAVTGSEFRRPPRTFTQSFDAPSFWQRYRSASFFLNHTIGRTVFLELAGDMNHSYRYAEYTTTNGLTNTLIDINRDLPTGENNPNFLQPYSEAVRARQIRQYTFGNVRGAAAWADSTRFGDFKVSLLGGLNDQRTVARFMQLNALLASDPRLWPLANQIRYRYYWNQTSRPLPELGRIQLVDPILGINRKVDTAYQPLPAQPALNSEGNQSYHYAQAATNAYLFKRSVVLLGAVRFDGYKNTFAYNRNFGDYPTNWDGTSVIYRPSAPPDYATLTYIPKDSAGRPTGPAAPASTRPRDANGFRLPQYGNDRFQDDYNFPAIKDQQVTYSGGGVWHARSWLSFYSNYAQTFTIPPPNATVTNEVLAATVSFGVDGGIRFSLLDQRVRLSVNRYLTRQKDQPFTGPIAGTVFNAIITANAVGDFSDAGTNQRNFPQTPPASIQDRRQVQANGWEVELVANPTKSLRLSANFALSNVDATDSADLTAAYVDKNLPQLRQIMVDAGALISASNVASLDASIPVNQRSPDVNAAISAWNSMIASRAGIVSQKQIVQRTKSANLYADYTFSEGKLRGLRLGAGARYRGPTVIGNRGADTIVNPANPTTAIDDPKVDAFTPIYSSGYTLATATVGYTVRFAKGRPVALTLRVDNALDESKPHYINTLVRPPGGDVTNPARISTPRDLWYNIPRSFALTAKVVF
jgi:outer membrane receptor protein involved in Fe transport